MNENIRIQEVDSVEKPPKARVESATDTSERKKDYLEGFLAQKPAAPVPSEPDGDLYEAVIAALKSQLANFKIPKKCFVVAELPRNTMGKVQKNLLRDQYKGLF
jgi:acyl-coenzyme A synthetase/AMP-(fatty) acid ligase